MNPCWTPLRNELLVCERSTRKMLSNQLPKMLSHSCGIVKGDVTSLAHTHGVQVTETSREQRHCQNELRNTIGSPVLFVRACGQGVLGAQSGKIVEKFLL